MENLGERIRDIRARLKLPRAEFALLVDVSPTALFNYESGDRIPNADVLARICQATGISPRWLLMGQGEIHEPDWNMVWFASVEKLIRTIADVRVLHLEPEQRNAIIGLIQAALVKRPDELLATSSLDLAEDDMAANVINAGHLFKRSSNTHESADMPVTPKRQSKKTRPTVTQTAKGSHIVQAGGDITGNINMNIKTTNKKVDISVQPPEGTIGANASLMERIKGLFNELGLRREERFGKTAYPVMYNEFKKAFDIPKTQKYTAYLLWPESRGKEIIDYLEEKLSNTIKGRRQSAARKRGGDSFQLLSESNKLHKMLGWTEQDYRSHLHYMFGVTSRADLTAMQLANYVAYLKSQIDG